MALERLDPANREDVAAVTALHRTYLPTSPVSKLGVRFMRGVYYSRMVADGLFGCTVCRVNGRIVGFISYTADSNGFLARGLKKHFWRIAGVMALSVLERPAILGDVLFVLKLMRARRDDGRRPETAGLGEAISMAVVPEFQNHIEADGTQRLAVRLFMTAANEARRGGARRLQLQVQPSNLSANLFYSALGCSFEKVQYAGMVIHLYTYDLATTDNRQ